MENLLKTERYDKKKCVWFFSSKDQNFKLSNMASMSVKYDGKIWNSAEQLYQASKYAGDVICLPSTGGDQPNVRQRIFETKNAMGAKMTQKCAVKAGLIRSDWEDVKIDNMLYVLKLKFKSNPVNFRKALGATGTLNIVEISRKDTFWGTKEMDPNVLTGQNVLGKLLMMVRSDMDNILSENLVEPDLFMLP